MPDGRVDCPYYISLWNIQIVLRPLNKSNTANTGIIKFFETTQFLFRPMLHRHDFFFFNAVDFVYLFNVGIS